MNDPKIQDKVVNGVQYYSAYFSCPVCIERRDPHPPTFWVHSSCPDGHLYIGSNATLYCSECRQTMKMMDVKYACPYHSNETEEYVGIGDPLTLAESLSSALALIKITGKEWVNKFVQSL